MLAHFLRSIADDAQRVGRQVSEQAIEVTTIECTTWYVLCRVADDRGQIDVQRREQLFQMVGAAIEILRIDVGIDRMRNIPSELRRIRCAPAAPDLWTSPAVPETSARELL